MYTVRQEVEQMKQMKRKTKKKKKMEMDGGGEREMEMAVGNGGGVYLPRYIYGDVLPLFFCFFYFSL